MDAGKKNARDAVKTMTANIAAAQAKKIVPIVTEPERRRSESLILRLPNPHQHDRDGGGFGGVGNLIMSEQILLLDVPKDSPSHEERLQAFKARVGIWTHDSGVKSDEAFPRWSALLLPKNSAGIEYYHYGDSDEPMEIIASSCRILDEAGYLVTGHTEREAIQNLCESNKIPFQP